MKKCPACAEDIQDEAKKCKHCGELIVVDDLQENKSTEETKEETPEEKINDKVTKKKMPVWMIITTIVFPLLALITLKKGYSPQARILSLGWLLLIVGGSILQTMTDPVAIEERRLASETRQQEKISTEKTAAQIAALPKGYDRGPSQQRFMAKLIAETKSSYTSDDNDAKKKRAWINASLKLCSSQAFNAFGKKTDWIGYVDTVRMDDDGTVRFEVDIDNSDNEAQDSKLDKRFHDYVMDLKASESFLDKGDMVKFSGFFKKGDMSENECIRGGLTRGPDLTSEGFEFKFTKIEKILRLEKDKPWYSKLKLF